MLHSDDYKERKNTHHADAIPFYEKRPRAAGVFLTTGFHEVHSFPPVGLWTGPGSIADGGQPTKFIFLSSARVMFAQATLNWTDFLPLTQSGISMIKDEIPGVYRLGYRTAEGGVVFYVGQAADLKARLFQHISENEQNRGIRNNLLARENCYFRCAIVNYQDDRDACEVALFKQCGGLNGNLANEIHPPRVAPASINFD